MTDSPSLEDQIVVALRRITRTIDLRSRVMLQFHGLTAPQLAVLRVVAQRDIVTPGEIARTVHLGQPTITGILARLGQRGLIERSRADRDKRSLNVRLSESGRALLQVAPSPLQDAFRQELSQLREWERTQILSTLQRIADMMHPPHPEAIADTLHAQLPPADERVFSVETEVILSAVPPWTEVPQGLL